MAIIKCQLRIVLFLLACIFISYCKNDTETSIAIRDQEPVAYTLKGRPLYANPPSEELMKKLTERKLQYEQDSTDIENMIWYGRFLAYAGAYQEALSIYNRAIELYPDDDRPYRHRGHRYITLRQFDKAIADLEYATKLIENKPNETEPDGMPNARNIPVSTKHGNIWYHLGLAYYLKQDMAKSLRAFQNCLISSSNADNVVSATHWLYMIIRRMGHTLAAGEFLNAITEDMEVIENHSYHKLCLFYKGEISEKELFENSGSDSSDDAILYGLANWYYYNGDEASAKEKVDQLLSRDSWTSFGYIAAEADDYYLWNE